MNVDITRLKSRIDEYTSIDEIYSFSKEQLENTDILELNETTVIGEITLNFDTFHLNIEVSGVMILPCAISLKPIKFPFSIIIDENLDTNLQENLKKSQNKLDILPIIWENILMEIPMKVVSDDLSDVKTSGDGWKLIMEKEEHINQQFEKLKDLL